MEPSQKEILQNFATQKVAQGLAQFTWERLRNVGSQALT